tara:strand:+ start:820 stop:1020 length:201 start_codon:yes stop_codon:yes gene_type:complete
MPLHFLSNSFTPKSTASSILFPVANLSISKKCLIPCSIIVPLCADAPTVTIFLNIFSITHRDLLDV